MGDDQIVEQRVLIRGLPAFERVHYFRETVGARVADNDELPGEVNRQELRGHRWRGILRIHILLICI